MLVFPPFLTSDVLFKQIESLLRMKFHVLVECELLIHVGLQGYNSLIFISSWSKVANSTIKLSFFCGPSLYKSERNYSLTLYPLAIKIGLKTNKQTNSTQNLRPCETYRLRAETLKIGFVNHGLILFGFCGHPVHVHVCRLDYVHVYVL